MHQLYDDDIIEYSQSLDKLQRENLELKRALRRFMVFGVQGEAPYNLDDRFPHDSLRDAEMMFGIMFDTLQVPAFAGSLVCGKNGIPTDFVFNRINKQFADYFHYEPHDIIGKSNGSLNLLKSKIWMQTISQTAKTLDSADIEIQEGDDTFHATVFSIRHDSFVAHFVSSNSSLSRSRSQEVLQNLRFTQMMVNAIPTPLFYKDMEGHYLLCNKSYAKTIIGVSPESIIGKTALELEHIFPKEYAGFYQEKDIELIKDKGIQTYEGPIKCADGTVREYIINKTLIKDEQGKFIGILGVMQDIDRLLKARRELAESENRYKALFNGISQPIIVVDTEGNIVMLNNTAVELFEEDEMSIMDNSRQIIPAQKLINMELINMVCKTGQPVTHRVSLDTNGSERWYLSTMQPINDFFGEKVVQIISNDITEIKHFQAELLEQKTRAEQSNNLKTIFLQNIAHETRTPVNIISGTVQMIKAGIHKDKHQEYLGTIYHNCKKLLDIIDDIVELSQIESGQIKIKHEICSINNIVEESFAYLSDLVSECGKPLEIKRTAPVNEYKSLIYADSQYISQALRKLISNAVTFTEKGSVEIGSIINEGTLTFYVRDTGIGIQDHKLKLIFERFRQGDEGASRQYGGTGLGLSIANELVKCMNGIISVSSTVNKGSDFRFTIPYQSAGA